MRRRLLAYILGLLGLADLPPVPQLLAVLDAHGEAIDEINDRLHDMDARISEFDVKGARAA